MNTDLDLLRALQSGNDGAFWTLWMRHAERLFAVCMREMNGNRVDAEDALHDSMLHAHAKLPRFAAGIASPASWLSRMTANVCRDMHRRRVRHSEAVDGVGVLRGDDVQLPEVPPAGQELDDYDPAALAALLPDRLRLVFVLRVLERVPYDDIASRLGLTCATVRKRVQESRATLRAWRTAHALRMGHPARDSPHCELRSQRTAHR